MALWLFLEYPTAELHWILWFMFCCLALHITTSACMTKRWALGGVSYHYYTRRIFCISHVYTNKHTHNLTLLD